MNQSLLFLPDISGFTEFVQNTEAKHSQHVIAELLEILVGANTQDMLLAEVEGDALFFYKLGEIPSLEKILAQVETMFTAFYSHLKLLEKNRVCPCNACSSAPKLQLKIIAHCGEIEFISVQDNKKPFGAAVIEAHRLMKNSVESDHYVLLSEVLKKAIGLPEQYQSMLFNFKPGANTYDGKKIPYVFSVVDKNTLKLQPFSVAKEVDLDVSPALRFEKEMPVNAPTLLEYITNYAHRHEWVKGVDKFEFNENEVTRLGSEHVCVINGKHLNFVVVTKKAAPGQLVYGELTTSLPPVDKAYQFYLITPLTDSSSKLEVELYLLAKSPFKKLALALFLKRIFKKNTSEAVQNLKELLETK